MYAGYGDGGEFDSRFPTMNANTRVRLKRPPGRRLPVPCLLALCLAGLPLAARADTAVFNASGTIVMDPDTGTADANVYLPQFSPANGQLTGVTLTLSFNFDSSYTFQNEAGGAAGQIEYTPHAQVIGTLWPLAPGNVQGDAILPPQTMPFPAGVATVGDTASGGPAVAVVNVAPARFSVFTGTSSVSGDVKLFDFSSVVNQSATPGAGTITTAIAASFTFSVTYTYTPVPAGPARLYVDADATGANDGSSWTDAFTGLQDALAAAGPGTELWIAEGVYRPGAPGASRTVTFDLPPGVSLYGGFNGSETSLGQRDPATHVTTLNGDLNDDDGAASYIDNAYHVVLAQSLLTPIALDGLTVSGGWASTSTSINTAGGGLYLNRCAGVTIRNCRFENNVGNYGAGALYDYLSNVTVEDSVFQGNWVFTGRGGAIYHTAQWSDASLTNTMTVRRTTFTGNLAKSSSGSGSAGGAIYGDFRAPLIIEDCLFENNEATWRFSYGGTASSGGALLVFGDDSRIINSIFRNNRSHVGGAIWLAARTGIVNCLFDNNSAFRQSVGFYDYGGYAGTIYCVAASTNPASLETVDIDNCTFSRNYASTGGGLVVVNYGAAWFSDVHVTNSIFYGNTHSEAGAPLIDAQILGIPNIAVLSRTCVEAFFDPVPGEDPKNPDNYPTVWDFDPFFFDAAAGDFRIGNGSPYIDLGANADYPATAPAIDLAGNPRTFDDPATPDGGPGAAPIIDLGAYEFGPWIDYGGNALPVAAFTLLQAGAMVTFTDTSGDPGGTVTQWVWDFGDGTHSTLQNPVHTYAANGDYDVVLRVRDDTNGSDVSAVQTVSVTSYAAPALAISSPASGETVAGTITLGIVATNPGGLTQVKYYLDGNFTGAKSELGDPPHPPGWESFPAGWDTTVLDDGSPVADGTYILTARGVDIDENEIFTPPISITIANTPPPTPLEIWRAGNFTAAELANPALEATVWGNDADPDADGNRNWAEYVLDGDPLDRSDAGDQILMRVVVDNGEPRIEVTYRQRIDDPSLIYANDISCDLSAWHSGPASVQIISVQPINSRYQQITFRDTGNVAAFGRCFARVSVSTEGG